jgi:NAD(P)-dependent dehydrogenase (short-subunit alcohol dehydrogenase family)
VRSFASAVEQRLGGTRIDALVLNAGRAGHAGRRTADGFETTFAVNYLAHYLLLRLLMPRLAADARVVLTTSGTHDPAERAPLPTPRHADARLLAHPDRDPERDASARTAAGRAYTSSKLCIVLLARAFATRPEAIARRFTVVAYDPGRTPGTGLMRDSGAALNLLWRALGAPLLWRLVPRANSRSQAGCMLGDLALGSVAPPRGRVYAALRRGRLTFPALSEHAHRDDWMELLWQDSAALLGLEPGAGDPPQTSGPEVARAPTRTPAS